MSSAGGIQLPLEILPLILQFLQWRSRDLHACCLVSKTWNNYATPRLYSRLFLRDQKRLIKALSTLQQYPHLAKLLRILEIRVFPFGLLAEDLERVEASLLDTLLQATNLVELYWTRTGSLTDRVLPYLPALPSLQTLELTGSSRFYTPSNVSEHLISKEKAPSLKYFSLLLPDRNVCEKLPNWANQLGSKLESLSILCQHSALISDEILKGMAQHLTGIKRLSIAGAKAVTEEGISTLIKGRFIEELAIEGLAIHPSTFLRLSTSLKSLRAISLTYPKQSLCSPHDFWQHLAAFVEDLPSLAQFTLYRSSWNTSRVGEEDMLDESNEDASDDELNEAHDSIDNTPCTPQEYRRQEMEKHANSGKPIIRDPLLSTSFLKRLLAARASTLTKLRIHGILMTIEQLRLVCEECEQVQDLVVQLFEDDKVRRPHAAQIITFSLTHICLGLTASINCKAASIELTSHTITPL